MKDILVGKMLHWYSKMTIIFRHKKIAKDTIKMRGRK